MDLREQQSLYVSGILAALGFSKREVNIRCYKHKLQDIMDNLICTYRPDIAESITSGSSSEGLSGGRYYRGEKSDFDSMKIIRYVKVFEEKEDIVSKEDLPPDIKPPTIVKEILDEEYPGYTKLVVVRADPLLLHCMTEKDGQYFLPNRLIAQHAVLMQKPLSIMSDQNPPFRKIKLTQSYFHGPAVNFNVCAAENTLSTVRELFGFKHVDESPYREVDMVLCIKSLRWPYEATNFIARPRPGLWPRKETVEFLVRNTPVFLAPIGHKNSPEVDLQWRLSFNVAEKILVEDFNETQIQCYALLKIYLKDCLKSVSPGILSSYCMKTALFWLSEREGKDNIIPSKLLHYFVQCLKLIQQWLDEHKMPHYFIETRNVFKSNIDPAEVTKLMQTMDETILEPMSVLKNCKSFTFALQASVVDPSLIPKLCACSYLFAWLQMRLAVLERIHTSGAINLLWEPYDESNILTSIRRYKQMIEHAQHLDYGQPLLKILKSFLGFICFTKYCDSFETTKDDLSLNEIEHLLLEGKDGDLALCPLKLATFYLGQDKICQVLAITTSVLQQQQQIQNRHTFIDNLYVKGIGQFALLELLQDMKTLDNVVDLAMANFTSKAHHDEILYCREGCTEVRQFLYIPIEAAKTLAFDVTFMLSESSAIPRAVKLELQFSELVKEGEKNYRGVKISPLVYALYLRFLAFKANEDQAGCIGTLSEFNDLLPSEPKFFQTIGYNLLASCHAMMGMSHDAAQSLCFSLKISPTRNNVAFGYFSFMYISLFR